MSSPLVKTNPTLLKMEELVADLNDAARKYYSGKDGEETPISDSKYDKMLAELLYLEEKHGYRLPNSPTSRVGFEEVEGKVKHYAPVLSLKDTKSVDEMLYFLGEKEGVLSWKLDGAAIVLYYKHGNLALALSRGDGMYGKDITKNVILMRYVPRFLPVKSNIIIRGEGCLSLKEFEQLKKTQEGEKYKNPRNLAAGLINGRKTTSTLLRHMSFITHSAVLIEGPGRDIRSRFEQLGYLKSLGFRIVEHAKVANYKLKHEIEWFTNHVEDYEFPVDGLVLALDDLDYGESLGATARWPKHSLAFKWPDEMALTRVTGMKWSVSQTGLITPVVLLKPVVLEGTEVKQANLHTLKIFEELGIGIGDTLQIYKANKIIPEVEENLTRSKTEKYPRHCPICNSETTVVETEKTRKLYCYNCGGK